MDIEQRLERIRSAKAAQGMNDRQLADAAGIDPSTVYRIFAGKVTPTSATLNLLEAALCISDVPRPETNILTSAESKVIADMLATNADRINQLRCHYNRQLAEKDRELDYFKSKLRREEIIRYVVFGLLFALSAFVIIYTFYDAAHPDIGWIREQLTK